LDDFELQQISRNVPPYSNYLSYEELEESSQALAREYPSSVEIISAGYSREKRPINALKIGEGTHNVLLYGFPNPEEPLGGLLIEYLSRVLASNERFLDEMDCTWYLIKCIDPDGAKLNEGYLKGPLTPTNFSKNYYRTPNYLTGELNFPLRYGTLLDLNNPTPETLALIKIMSGVEFHFISSLHVMKFGEMTFEVSGPCPEIYAPLQRMAIENQIPLRKRLGDIVAPGIQLAHYMTPVGNYIRKAMQGLAPLQTVTGGFSFEFARMINPRLFMMIPECTTWYDPRCYDDSPSDTRLRETMDYMKDAFGRSSKLVCECYQQLRPYLDPNSPYVKVLGEVVEGIVNPKIGVIDPDPIIKEEELNNETMLSQKISTEGRADVYKMFNVGASLRMIDLQLSSNHENSSQLKQIREKLQAEFDEYSETLDQKYSIKHYPLQKLVRMNLGGLLHAIEYANKLNAPFTMWH